MYEAYRRRMKLQWLRGLLMLATLVPSAAAEQQSSDSALADIRAVVEQHSVVLAAYVRADDSKCAEAEKDFDVVAGRIGFFMPFIRVDCQQHSQLCNDHNVTKFPSVILLRYEQQAVEYTGPLEADELVFFALRANYDKQLRLQDQQQAAEQRDSEQSIASEPSSLGPATLHTVSQVANYREYHDVTVLGFFSDEHTAAAHAFVSSASTFTSRSDIGFAKIRSQELASSLGISSSPAVRLLVKGGTAITYRGNHTSKAKLTSWVSIHGVVLLKEFDESKMHRVRRGPPALFFFHVDKYLDKDSKAVLEEVASEFVDVLDFYTAELDQYSAHARELGFYQRQNSMAIVFAAKKTHFVHTLDRGLDAESVRNFCNDFLADKLSPAIRSAQPKKEQTGPVIELVSQTFLEVVGDETKDVLVEFCQEGPADCAKIHNLTEDLGAALADSPTIVVTRINVQENDVTQFVEMDYVPQLIMFPGSNKTGVAYTGPGAVKNVLDFISTHATFPVKYEPIAAQSKSASKEEEEAAAAELEQAKMEKIALENLQKTLF